MLLKKNIKIIFKKLIKKKYDKYKKIYILYKLYMYIY